MIRIDIKTEDASLTLEVVADPQIPGKKLVQVMDNATKQAQQFGKTLDLVEKSGALDSFKSTVPEKNQLPKYENPPPPPGRTIQGKKPRKFKKKTCRNISCTNVFNPTGPTDNYCSDACRPPRKTPKDYYPKKKKPEETAPQLVMQKYIKAAQEKIDHTLQISLDDLAMANKPKIIPGPQDQQLEEKTAAEIVAQTEKPAPTDNQTETGGLMKLFSKKKKEPIPDKAIIPDAPDLEKCAYCQEPFDKEKSGNDRFCTNRCRNEYVYENAHRIGNE